jgi:hypothetical protein
MPVLSPRSCSLLLVVKAFGLFLSSIKDDDDETEAGCTKIYVRILHVWTRYRARVPNRTAVRTHEIGYARKRRLTRLIISENKGLHPVRHQANRQIINATMIQATGRKNEINATSYIIICPSTIAICLLRSDKIRISDSFWLASTTPSANIEHVQTYFK